MKIIIIVLVVLAILFFIGTFVLYKVTFSSAEGRNSDPYVVPDTAQIAAVKDKMYAHIDELMAIEYESVEIESFDGITLFGRYYHVEDGAPLQIQFHGYHGNGVRDFCGGNKVAREYGMNTIIIDERGHGKSGGNTISFGINERYDVKSWCEYAVDRFGSDVKIVIAGVSMGAATVLMAAELDLPENVVGVIADCPFSSPIKIIEKVVSSSGFPFGIVKPFVKAAARIYGHFSLEASEPIKAVKNTDIPILLIHGDDDNYVPHSMSVALKEANPELIEFHSFPGAGHGLSYMVDDERYREITIEFLDRVLK